MSAAPRDYWRSLEELAESPGFAAIVEREAPRFRDVLGLLERRRFLQLMAAAMALGGLSGCGPETNPRQLLPYRRRLRAALETGGSWHAVSLMTTIPYSTVKKHARAMGYEPRRADVTKNRDGKH